MTRDYSNSVIYKLESEKGIYIGSSNGSTIKNIRVFNSEKATCVASKLFENGGKPELTILYQGPFDDRHMLESKKGEFIKQMKQEGKNVINRSCPGRDYAAYYQERRDHIKALQKKYYWKRKEAATEVSS